MMVLITSNSYLDNSSLNGMRYSLLKEFDYIYILNLNGGWSKKGAINNADDENVFGIKVGTAIIIGIKKRNSLKTADKAIFCYNLVGNKTYKYNFLKQTNIEDIEWKAIKPKPSDYYFIDKKENEVYNQWFKFAEIFSLYKAGIKTSMDNYVIFKDMNQVEKVLDKIMENIEYVSKKAEMPVEEVIEEMNKVLAYVKSGDVDNIKKCFKKILYRAFDYQHIIFLDKSQKVLASRPVHALTKHIIDKDNLVILTTKQQLHTGPWRQIYITDSISEHVAFPSSNSTYCFPLYLYDEKGGRRYNISQHFIEAFGFETTGEEVFYYITAFLHSTKYREMFSDDIRIDFPRIPAIQDSALFKELCAIGKQLVDLYLMRSPILEKTPIRYPVAGDNTVRKISYSNGKLWINNHQYFDGISEAAWEYQIGFYRVIKRWLEGRKGKVLSYDDITYIQKLAVGIESIINITKDVDSILDKYNFWDFNN